MPIMKRMTNNVTKLDLGFSKKFGCKSCALIIALPYKRELSLVGLRTFRFTSEGSAVRPPKNDLIHLYYSSGRRTQIKIWDADGDAENAKVKQAFTARRGKIR